jgi:hypothetical protein
MRVIAELHSNAAFELNAYSQTDILDFRRQLDWVCASPIDHSSVFYDPAMSQYVLRCFPFGVGIEKVAIFSFDGHVLRVLRCRLAEPRRRRNPDMPLAGGRT